MANDSLAERFEEQRPHLRSVAYRMLGSLPEADDAVQDAWLRASRSRFADIANLDAWLTTIVARICLNMLRARRTRAHQAIDERLPDPLISPEGSSQPEEQALLADSVGLALMVVLETLAPDERLAFVLHDVFKVPFDEIAPLVERTPAAARQLASRARRRVTGAGAAAPKADYRRQRAIVSAFFAAARAGDFEGLVAVLDPSVVLRADFGARKAPLPRVTRGPAGVAELAFSGARLPGAVLIPVRMNGSAGVIIAIDGRPFSLMGFVIAGDRIVEIHAIVDARRVAALAGSVLPSRTST
jgi:RNA polymerase sigma-70 factor (ECF subfamily)